MFSEQFPAVKIEPHGIDLFFLQLIENTAHIMHDLKHPGEIAIYVPYLKMSNQMLP